MIIGHKNNILLEYITTLQRIIFFHFTNTMYLLLHFFATIFNTSIDPPGNAAMFVIPMTCTHTPTTTATHRTHQHTSAIGPRMNYHELRTTQWHNYHTLSYTSTSSPIASMFHLFFVVFQLFNFLSLFCFVLYRGSCMQLYEVLYVVEPRHFTTFHHNKPQLTTTCCLRPNGIPGEGDRMNTHREHLVFRYPCRRGPLPVSWVCSLVQVSLVELHQWYSLHLLR